MRYFLSLIFIALLASPVMGAEKASNAEKTPAAPKAGKTEEILPMGGFEGPVSGADAETAEKALRLSPDSRVLLKGHIVSRLVGERNIYLFKDDSGQIEVQITPKQFGGQIIRPETSIQITGKIDKPSNPGDKPRVKVRELDILK